jgi:hypothetical protein
VPNEAGWLSTRPGIPPQATCIPSFSPQGTLSTRIPQQNNFLPSLHPPAPPQAIALLGGVHEAHEDAVIIKQRGHLRHLEQAAAHRQ